ncbi:hypothetical protein PVK06_021069 [Gossypium arboreum]|uniref:Uncharacterized protein n=1 Tax=Gossypium arboreum TaxID=29729 RepID=A0ABR0PP08_GOSAR|nr:hypothetical protein PVK06_021069 [Gossypium arboreum]
MFNDTTKAIRRAMSTNTTLPHGTYFSYILRRLGISTLRDIPISSSQPISYGIIHHLGYHYDANFNAWIKSGHLEKNEDEDFEGAFEDILNLEHVPSPEHVPPPASSYHATQPLFDINIAILDTLHSLSSNVQGLQDAH